jgi:hypothetical protein
VPQEPHQHHLQPTTHPKSSITPPPATTSTSLLIVIINIIIIIINTILLLPLLLLILILLLLLLIIIIIMTHLQLLARGQPLQEHLPRVQGHVTTRATPPPSPFAHKRERHPLTQHIERAEK